MRAAPRLREVLRRIALSDGFRSNSAASSATRAAVVLIASLTVAVGVACGDDTGEKASLVRTAVTRLDDAELRADADVNELMKAVGPINAPARDLIDVRAQVEAAQSLFVEFPDDAIIEESFLERMDGRVAGSEEVAGLREGLVDLIATRYPVGRYGYRAELDASRRSNRALRDAITGWDETRGELE